MNTGLDIGNGWTKFEDMRFASKVKVGKLATFGDKAKEKHQVNYKGTDYIVGEGNIFIGDDRYNTLEYKLSVLTALGILHGDNPSDSITAKICVGVPIGAFRRVSDKLKNILLSMVNEKIVVNGRSLTITIEDATIFVEGAYPLLAKETLEGNTITIDVGAGTVNVTEWQGQTPIIKKTYNEAFYKMQDDIATLLSEDYGLVDVSIDNVDQYMGKSNITVGNRVIDISEHIKIMESTIQGIASKIRVAFGTTTARKIYLMGGGAIATAELWGKYLGAVMVENSQFINSRIYKSIAVQTYGN